MADAGSGHIVVVDDEQEMRDYLAEVLTLHGYRCLMFPNGNAALSHLAAYGSAAALILSDINMPGMSGRVLADTLSPLRPGMKVLYMSGYSDGAVAKQGILEDGISILRKPFTKDELTRRVEEILFGVPQ